MKPLRTLLAGLGARGQYWGRVLNDSPACKIVGYVDPNPQALEAASVSFGENPGFASVQDALQALDAIDAIVLATPPDGREAQLRPACERQIPVLVEKPLALDLPTAAQYVHMAEESGTPLMVGLNFRYLAVTQQSIELYKQGVVGQPAFARFTYERYRDGYRPGINRYPLTMEHPMLWEQSIHHFDLLRYVYGTEPVSVYCRAWNPSWSMYAHETNVSAIFTFENGLLANYQGTWQSGWVTPHFEWRTDCDQGVVTQRDQFGELYYAKREQDQLHNITLPPHETWVTDTAGVLAAFVSTLRDKKPLECSGRDHLISLAMVQACIDSSKRGQSVDIAPILASFER